MKTIFIVGVSGTLGQATALLFLSKGWRVIGTTRNPDSVTELSKLENIKLFQLDVTNVEQIEKTIDRIIHIYAIDVYFYTVGQALIGPFESYTDEHIEDAMETNLLGMLRISKHIIKYFREREKQGVILVTSSAVAVAANPLSSVYCATKWAIEGWVESVSHELSPWGIAVKTVSPGGIQSLSGARSLTWVNHHAYTNLLKAVMAGFDDSRLIIYSEPNLIADVVYEAATDGKDQVRYFAGPDVLSAQLLRQDLGAEGHRKYIRDIYQRA
jgi:NAD(P)-dependent dehydrogenase (short-subunit alcohol dehydrogenase family)